MKRRMFCVAVAAVMTTTVASAADGALLSQVRQRLVDAPVLKGTFEQRKSIKGFRNPLLSHGDFLVARDRGVVWATREPFASALIVTRDRLLSRQADGTVNTKVDASHEPGIRAVNEMLFALMSANLTALSARFDIDGSLVGKDGWKLVLRPREAALSQWVSLIELDGDRFVRKVRFSEASGDNSEIVLAGHATSTALTPDDAARFN